MMVVWCPEFIILTLVCQTAVVSCYSSGSPAESCITLSPSSVFHGTAKQTNEVPYEIDTSVFEDPYSSNLFYVSNSTYKSEFTLLIKSQWGYYQFHGCSYTSTKITLYNNNISRFLIQAQLAADDTTVVGSFASPTHGDNYRLSSCARQEVHSHRSKAS